MWNRRKEEEFPPKPGPVSIPPAPAQPSVKEVVPMSAMPGRIDPDSSRGSAVIGKAVTVKGQIYSREDLVVDGEVEGTVELQEHRLTVGPSGKVQASVKSREIVVLGTIHGNVEATDKIDIRKEARLVGDIKTARIVIEDGAYFKGSIDIVKADAKPAAPQKPQQPASSGAPISNATPMAASAVENKR